MRFFLFLFLFSLSVFAESPLSPMKVIIVDPSTGNSANVTTGDLNTTGGGGGGNVTVNPNTNGSISNYSVGTGGTSVSAPTNAVGLLVESESTNSANCRYAFGGTATASVGILIEPGRDSGYLPIAATLTLWCASASQAIDVQWVLSQ